MGFLVSVILIASAVLGLCVRILLKKNGHFSSQHIGASKAMRDRGIHCVNTQDFEMRHKVKIDTKKL